ncbi:MAG: tyrosine-type recombinase/integrase [Paracoccaceae bacterium]
MAYDKGRLNAKQVEAMAKPGHYADGKGLYLQVSKWGTKSWVFKFTLGGRTRGMGLGPIDELSLKKAREEVERLRVMVREGRDPIEERAEQRRKMKAQYEESDTSILFKEAIAQAHARKEGEFSSEKHRKDWRSSLDTYAVPKLGKMNVADITHQDVLRVLNQPVDEAGSTLWETKTDTATRLRGRIESVLSWATVSGYRTGDNPARWAGNLKELLPKPSKVSKVTKQPALSQADFPKWFAEMRKRDGMATRCLEFAVLCASRSGEVRGATWDEIDHEARIWKIPGARMKMERDHRIPLSDEAVALLKATPRVSGSPYVFPAVRGGALSDMSLSALMRRLQEAEVKAGRKGWLDPDSGRPAVPHGLRSTFRVWTAERGYDRDMAEMALAHSVGSAVERAYQRSDMVERRRAMMADWAAFCHGKEPAENVVPLRGAA